MVKLDDIQKCINDIASDVKEIRTVLSGSDISGKGLVAEHGILEKRVLKLRDEIKRIKIIGTILAGILTFFISIAKYITEFFS